MSVNTAHANRGVLIHTGECILLLCKNVDIEFPNQSIQIFRGIKPGYVYLTSHRMIFKSKRQTEILQSLSAPFIAIDGISVHKESFSLLDANSISGTVRAQPNGNFNGKIEFKLFFKTNRAAVDFADTLKWAISMTVLGDVNRYLLPPYKPPRVWYEAPCETHKCPSVFKKWLPTNDLFQIPSPNSVFMSDNYPPFPAIDTTNVNRKESKLNCVSNTTPRKNVKFPTSTESSDGFIQPPIYGIMKCTNMDGSVFPHQAANLLFVQYTPELPN